MSDPADGPAHGEVRPLRLVRWELVAAWAAVGICSGVAGSDILTRLALLLIPGAVLAAWLLWKVDVTRDCGAGLIGLAVGPVLVARRAQNPPCSVSEFAVCEPGQVWPWLGIAALLVLIGAAVMAAPVWVNRRGKSNEIAIDR